MEPDRILDPRQLKVQLVPVDKLKPFEGNPREHADHDVEAVVESMRHFGWTNPIIVQAKTMRILAGHGRVLAAKKLGLRKVPVIIRQMSDKDATAYTVADNRLAELSTWNQNKLSTILAELEGEGFDTALIGFDASEVKKMIDQEAVDYEEAQAKHARMEIQPFEHHDYLVFVFRDSRDFLAVLTKFGVKKVDASMTAKRQKVGLGRVLDGRRLLDAPKRGKR